MCNFMYNLENNFHNGHHLLPLLWFWYIVNAFYISSHDEESLKTFLLDLHCFNQYIEFPYGHSVANIQFPEAVTGL